MKYIDDIILELQKFSTVVLTLEKPLINARILDEFEKKHNVKLPDDFKYFISKHNGIDLMGVQIYGLGYSEDLESVFEFEHNQVAYPQFNYLVPFSPDGSGNFYCFDTRQQINGSCRIVFWVSNYEYTKDDQPEVTNENFADWVREVVVEWTLKDYNYDGSEK